MLRLRYVLTSLLILVLALSVWTGVSWYAFIHKPVVISDQGFKYHFQAGSSYKTLSKDLHDKGLIDHPHFFNWLVCYEGIKSTLKAGEYLFPKGSTPLSILNQISGGTGLYFHSFTIIPGQTFRQVRHALDAVHELKHTTSGLSDANIMHQLGSPTDKPEGLFFPDTYNFALGTSDFVILKNAYLTMQRKVDDAWQHRAPNLPINSPYEVLIAASIIEKETDLDLERPIIAGVMENRLRRGILLQFDPTVIYGLGSRFTGKIYRENLLDKNPYNTYVIKGLPPTPISMPSYASILGVTQPDKNNYLYFVAKANGVGHQFSNTLAEHNAAVANSRSMHMGFFNVDLIRSYLQKQFSQKIFNTN